MILIYMEFDDGHGYDNDGVNVYDDIDTDVYN
jgi:hypothetical protein